jgi:hypothetical protein
MGRCARLKQVLGNALPFLFLNGFPIIILNTVHDPNQFSTEVEYKILTFSASFIAIWLVPFL